MSLYGFTYTTFIAIEFSLYESFLHLIENSLEGKSLLDFLLNKSRLTQAIADSIKSVWGDSEKNKTHNSSDVIVAGVIAGATAGFLTNAIELLAVNKQTNPQFSVN